MRSLKSYFSKFYKKSKTLNDYFSKIYCINLDERTDKYEECLIEFKKVNIKVERFAAIKGPNPKKNKRSKSGEVGLRLTSIEILKNAINNNYQNILILEDDVTFVEGFNDKLNKAIKYLPENWDLLYIGGNHFFNKGEFSLVHGDKNFKINKNNYKTLNHKLCKTTWTQTTHAIAINSKFFETALETVKETRLALDQMYCKLQQNNSCNAYTFLPSLALQRPTISDIENKYVDYNKMGIYHF